MLSYRNVFSALQNDKMLRNILERGSVEIMHRNSFFLAPYEALTAFIEDKLEEGNAGFDGTAYSGLGGEAIQCGQKSSR